VRSACMRSATVPSVRPWLTSRAFISGVDARDLRQAELVHLLGVYVVVVNCSSIAW